MLRGIKHGISGLFASISGIKKYGLWKHILFTSILSLLVATFTFYGIWSNSGFISDWISGFYKWERGSGIISWISDWLVWGIMMVVAFMSYKYIMMILASPVLSLMSEKIESYYTQVTPQKFSISHTIKSLGRGLRISLGNISKELILTLILIVLGLIPGVAIVTAPLILVVQAYFAGFGNMDYYMERHFNVKQSRSFVSSHKGLAIVNGGAYLLLLSIPVIGFILGPTLTSVGASIAVHNSLKK